MFNNSTVFVLGAGASWHYGYPTGEELVKRASAKAASIAEFFQHSSRLANGQIPEFISHGLKKSSERGTLQVRQAWQNAFHEAEQLSTRLREVNPTLIDYFLKQNADLHRIGKLAIAMVIFDCETQYARVLGNPNHLELHSSRVLQGSAEPSVRIQPSAFRDDWLRFVLYKITSHCQRSTDLLSNKITFVTFNYDPSIERRLYLGLKNISLFAEADITRFLSRDRIVHVYGSVRESIDASWHPVATTLTKSNEIGELEETKRRLDFFYKASLGIHTIDGPEKEKNADALNLAKEAIAEARKIFILGYGFDESNSVRIGLDALRERPPHDRTVLFTNFGGHNRVGMAASRVMFGDPGVFISPNPPIRSELSIVQGFQRQFRWEMSTKDTYAALNEDFESLETD